MSPIAFQDLMPNNHCFGCGPLNLEGLRIRSFWDGDESVCTFEPGTGHAAGPRHFLNGGITATLVDCHSVCTATAWAYRSEAREIGSDPQIWCVTGSLEVRFLAPVPIGDPVDLRARIETTDGKKTVVSCSVFSGGSECATGRVVAIRVPPSWRNEHST